VKKLLTVRLHRNRLVNFSTVILIFLYISLSSSSASADSITITLNSEKYTISNDESGYSIINMEGFNSLTSPGDPMLPHKKFDILIPMEADGTSVKMSILSNETQVLEGTYDIKPTPPVSSGQSTEIYWEVNTNISDGKNMDIYGKDANYPEDYVRLLPVSQMRKYKFVPVDFTAFRYNPISKNLTLIKKVTFQISYNITPLSSAAQRSFNVIKSDRVMDDLASTQFYNYDEAKTWYEPVLMSSGTTYDYVIITTNAIRNASTTINDFRTHKQNMGHNVLVVTETDFDGLAGAQRADRIRQWLINNYISMGIKYVLLIGDPTPNGTGIPMKVCYPDSVNATPTDSYYADLTGNWNRDGDSRFGEWTGDYRSVSGGVDFSPEVFVGRIPYYGSITDLNNVLQKTINYETETSTAWRKSVLLPMSFSDASTDGARLAEQMIYDYLSPKGYSYYRFYQQGSACSAAISIYTNDEELRANTRVRDRWASNPVGILCWWGHGSVTAAACGYSGCSDGNFFTSAYCSNLNDYQPAFTYLCSCTNGYPENASNLQYMQLKRGAIASCGATRVSWYYVGQSYGTFDGSGSNSGLGYEYCKAIVNEYSSGESLELAKKAIVPSAWQLLMNWYDFNIYGDPSIKIKNNPPNTPACSTDAPCNAGNVCCEEICKAGNCCSNSQCSGSTPICTNNACTACTSNDQCGTGNVCCEGACKAGTTCEANTPPNTPSAPSGNSSGYTFVPYSYSTYATDPDGDQVKYTFDWGDGTTNDTGFASVNSASLTHIWSKTGTFQVKTMATDSNGAISAWSNSLTVTIAANSPPNTPSIPYGSSSGYAWVSYSYRTSATDPNGNQVKYTFDWGDGTTQQTSFVNSGSNASSSHIWSTAKTYQVKAMATDSRGASSGWSSPRNVTIAANNPPNMPSQPAGPASGRPGTYYRYSTNTTDLDGNQLRYTFDWGDGRTSKTSLVNSGTNANASHTWSRAGTYQVKAMATDSRGASSGWSDSLAVKISSTVSSGERDNRETRLGRPPRHS
jgi:hypothetical protein